MADDLIRGLHTLSTDLAGEPSPLGDKWLIPNEAAARIEALSALVLHLQKVLGDEPQSVWRDVHLSVTADEAIADFTKEREALEAENNRLRALLDEAVEVVRPFAETAASYDPNEDDGHLAAWAHDLTISSLRRARAFLAKMEKPDGR